MDQETLHETGVPTGLEAQVLHLARLGRTVGINGFVTSPRELASLRNEIGPDATMVIPGVRPMWAEAGDQKRIMPPGEIVKAGADYLVVGRPITAAADPLGAVDRLCAEIA
jgi:orotidine-5'-phosphate decarboxylase